MKPDISKCFDKISHKAILKGVVLPGVAKRVLREAIKAGVKGEYFSSEEGTPQGGVISPLLANIALDGFENLGSDQWKGNRRDGTLIRDIRYADDAIFICKPRADIQKLRSDIDEWLAQRGLKVNEAKTPAQARRSAGVSRATEGFDFLGWHFRVDSRGRFKSTPSRDAYKRIKEKVRKTWKDTGVPDKSGKKRDTEFRLKAIGSKVRGWRNYHRFCDMGNHSLWFVRQWLWKKLRKEKARTKEKEIRRLLSKKKAGSIVQLKASELESKKKEISNASQTPKACLLRRGARQRYGQTLAGVQQNGF